MTISNEGTKEQIPLDHRSQVNLERFAIFMAEMIEKYGREVLAEIEAGEQAENQEKVHKE